MQLNILFIAIFAAVLVNYMSSANYELQIHIIESDQDIKAIMMHLRTGVLPILIIRNIEENPLNDENTMKTVKNAYEECGVANLFVVPTDMCVETSELIKMGIKCSDHEYPSLVCLNNLKLFPKRWNSLDRLSLLQSFYEVSPYNPGPRPGITFDILLGLRLEKSRNANSTHRQILPAMPMSTQPITQAIPQSAYPPANFRQTTPSIRAMTSQMPTWMRPPMNIRFTSGQTSQLRWPTNLAQTSVIPWSTGATKPASWMTAPVNANTAYQSMSTQTTTPGTSTGVRTIISENPKTLDLLSTVGEQPLMTQDLLGIMEQSRGQEHQNYEVGSNFTPSEYSYNYIQFIDEGGPSKKRKTKENSP